MFETGEYTPIILYPFFFSKTKSQEIFMPFISTSQNYHSNQNLQKKVMNARHINGTWIESSIDWLVPQVYKSRYSGDNTPKQQWRIKKSH